MLSTFKGMHVALLFIKTADILSVTVHYYCIFTGPLKGVFILLISDVPGGKSRFGDEAAHHGQAVLHKPGPVVQCKEQRSSQ